MAGEVELIDLVKRFGEITAVDGINLEMPSGEFFSMLGPSGCGKTTTLRMIAGFEQPTEGRILLDGIDMQFTRSYKRNVNTVFQNYALFPHLNVFDNVAFGLRRQKVSKHEIARRVAEALEQVGLTGLEKRKPGQMSGGQQQRVALARALVLKPAVLLLDEPLGALDAKLRKQLQIELKALQQNVGITFVYVTHDQEEALTMSDRIAVMSNGKIEQVAPPRDIYEEPSTTFVADFLGISNLMEAEAFGSKGDGRCRVKVGEFELDAARGHTDTIGATKITIRPERVKLEDRSSTGPNRMPGMIERSVYLGNAVRLIVRLANGDTVQALIQSDSDDIEFAQGDPVTVHMPAEALRVLTDTGTAPTDEEAGPSASSRLD
jgi:spermidine/putrescine transport system ATP-binding protein